VRGCAFASGEDLVAAGLGVALPPVLLQRQITGYVLHGNRRSIHLDGEELGEISYALRRVELDSLLIKEAEASGVRVVNARATRPGGGTGRVVVYTEGGSFHGDAAVARSPSTPGWRRPSAGARPIARPLPGDASLQDSSCGLDFVPRLLEDCIHVFLPSQRGIDFGH